MFNLLNGIKYLHDYGICHRDIKPGNIYITKDLEHLKIIDFNVALAFKASPANLFGVTGEEAYSAPELSSGQTYDERIDLWSAGVVMF
jgi:serine/threonine protein kinase